MLTSSSVPDFFGTRHVRLMLSFRGISKRYRCCALAGVGHCWCDPCWLCKRNGRISIVAAGAILIGLMLLTQGCAFIPLVAGAAMDRCPTSYADQRYETDRLTDYAVPRKLFRSPDGVSIGPGVDGTKVDLTFQTVAKCLGRQHYACAVHAVFIAPDWTEAYDNLGDLRQVFPCKHPKSNISQLCTGATQWPSTIVITPDHHALGWEVERLLLMDDPTNDGGRNCWQKVPQ